MEEENIIPEEQYLTKKIRIYPNQKQKSLFNKCINGTRYFFNKANEHIINIKETEEKFKLPSVIDLRSKILTNDSDLSEKDLWQKEIPYDTRELAIRRLYKSYKTTLQLLKGGKIKHFDIKYKKKKDNEKSFEVNKNAITITEKGNIKIFKQRLNDELRLRKRDREKLKKLKINKPYTNTIIKKEYDNWYICLSIPKDKSNINKEEPIFSSVFLDPGTRKFQTFYSPDGICGTLGDKFSKKEINPIIGKYEKMKSIIGNKKIYRNEKNIKRRCGRLITKVKNKVSDMHNQVANLLTTTFKTIFIPIFETKKMIKKETRNITRTTAKDLQNLSHYKFRMKLENMCKSRGNNYKVITEENTSKTCTGCGKKKEDLGSSEVYKCEKCKIKIDRDVNASRNICIKNIKEYGAIPIKSS
jgi:transposase